MFWMGAGIVEITGSLNGVLGKRLVGSMIFLASPNSVKAITNKGVIGSPPFFEGEKCFLRLIAVL